MQKYTNKILNYNIFYNKFIRITQNLVFFRKKFTQTTCEQSIQVLYEHCNS